MENPFFSVIMPVYGVESFLEKAICSVLSQTFTDFEVILVNDCSPDCSAEICHRFSDKYDNITTVDHKKNLGLSSARNTGFAASKGKYVWFMDSDDYVEPDLLQAVYESLKENEADVVVFGCNEDYYNQKGEVYKTYKVKPEKAFCKNEDEVHKKVIELELGSFYGYAWNKIYSSQIIRRKQLSFRDVVLIEDIDFNIRFFDSVKRLNVLDGTFYHYAKRGTTSLTSKFVPKYYQVHRERISMLYRQQENWNNAGEYEKSVLACIYTRYIFSALSRNCDKRANMTHRERKQWIKEVFSDPLFCDLIPFAKPFGTVLKIMTAFLKNKYVNLCLFSGRVIFFIQNNMKAFFVRIKQERG